MLYGVNLEISGCEKGMGWETVPPVRPLFNITTLSTH